MCLRSFDAATSCESIRTYLRLYHGIFHAISFVNYAHVMNVIAFEHAFGERTRRTLVHSTRMKEISFRAFRELAPGLQVSVATTFPHYRMLLLSPTRRRPSLRVLSPRSRPALGLTSLLACTHHDSTIQFGISCHKRGDLLEKLLSIRKL